MFGSEITATVVFDTLSVDATIQTAVGSRIFPLSVIPEPFPLPALVHYMTSSQYDGPLGTGIPASLEELRYNVKLVCEGMDTDPIWTAAERQAEILGGNEFQIIVHGQPYVVGFTEFGEAPEPLPITFQEGLYYRELGTAYVVHVARG